MSDAAGKGNMIGLPQLKARVERQTALEMRLAAELAAWEDAKHPLTEMERQRYVGFLEQARAALRNARDLLAMAVKRPEFDARTEARAKQAEAVRRKPPR